MLGGGDGLAARELLRHGDRVVFLGGPDGSGTIDAVFVFDVGSQPDLFRCDDTAYGKGAGGIINIVSKSGKRNFFGELYYFNRNEAFNANNFFSNRQANCPGGAPESSPVF